MIVTCEISCFYYREEPINEVTSYYSVVVSNINFEGNESAVTKSYINDGDSSMIIRVQGGTLPYFGFANKGKWPSLYNRYDYSTGI